MRNHYYLYLLLPLLFLHYQGIAQMSSVTFDTETEDISAADRNKIIFDEPFEIKIKAPNISYVKMRYRILRSGKPLNAILADSVFSSSGNFNLVMPALKPNRRYGIEFITIKKLSLADDKTNKLKASIVNLINSTYDYNRTEIPFSDETLLKNNITAAIKNAVSSKQLYSKGDPINPSDLLWANDNPANISFAKITSANDKLYKVRRRICGEEGQSNNSDIVNFIDKYKEVKKEALSTLLKSTVKADIAYLDRVANPVIDPKATNRQVLEIIHGDLEMGINVPNLYEKIDLCNCKTLTNSAFLILAGKAKITGNLVEANAGFDIRSGQLLLSTLVSWRSHKNLDNLNELIEHLSNWIKHVKEFNQEKELLAKAKEEFPNVLEGIYTEWNTGTSLDLHEPINTKGTRYLGLDFGALWVPDINSVLAFQGTNLHFRPVNRNAKFKDLKSLDRFLLSRASITVGLAQRVYKEDDGFQRLTDFGSPLVGAGYRITRMLRINGGLLFYKKDNLNPLIEKTSNEKSFYIGLSIDFALRGAFGGIGNLGNF